MATMATKPNVICEETLTLKFQYDAKMEQKCRNCVKRAGQNYETSWDIVGLVNNSPEIHSFKDPESQLKQMEDDFFRSNIVPQFEDVPQPVNADELLQIFKKVGLKCPECGQKNVKYNMVQSRSADEGMTAQCECRECQNRFNIKM